MRKLLFLIMVKTALSQNLTINENQFYSGTGYIFSYTIFDTIFNDPDSTILFSNFGTVFIPGQSLFLDSLCENFTSWETLAYNKNINQIKDTITKYNYYYFTQRPLKYCFRHPKKDSVSIISSDLISAVKNDTLTINNALKGIYFRIIKVKIEGWLIQFKDFKQLVHCYAPTSWDKNGKIMITPTMLKKFEPPFRIYKEPFPVIYPKQVLFYSDWILSPLYTDIIDFFYKNLYLGKNKHSSYQRFKHHIKENKFKF